MSRTTSSPWTLSALLCLWAPMAMANPGDPGDLEIQSLADDRSISFAEAAERLSWQGGLDELADLASAELGEQFAGVWIDVDDGDRVKLALTQGPHPDPFGAAQQIVDQLGLGYATDLLQVTYGIDELEAANEAIGDMLVAAGAQNQLAVGLRTDLNAVELDLPPAGPSAAQVQLVDDIRQQFGHLLVETDDAQNDVPMSCSGTNCDAPVRGGVSMTTPDPTPTQPGRLKVCSTGFMTESRTDGKIYALTAGHCLSPFPTHRTGSGTPSVWSIGDTSGGTITLGDAHNFVHGTPGDVGIVHIDTAPVPSVQNWVWVRASTSGTTPTTSDETYPIHRVGRSSIGMRICMSGQTTGTTCGTVKRLGVTMTNSDGITRTNLGVADLCIAGGDSGGPLYAYHSGFGILAGRFTSDGECRTTYTGLAGAENTLNVDVLH